MAIVRTKAILLKNYPFGESSEIAILLTEKLGKVKIAVKGSRRLKSSTRAKIIPYAISDLVIYVHPKKEVYNIKEAHLIKVFKRATDMEFQKIVSGVLNIIDNYVYEGPGGERIFRLLQNFLEILDVSKNGKVLQFSFILKFLKIIGLSPILRRCVVCGREEELGFFSATFGGVLCSNCAKELDSHIVINEGFRKALIFLEEKDFEHVSRFRTDMEKIGRVLKEYLEYHLGVTIPI